MIFRREARAAIPFPSRPRSDLEVHVPCGSRALGCSPTSLFSPYPCRLPGVPTRSPWYLHPFSPMSPSAPARGGGSAPWASPPLVSTPMALPAPERCSRNVRKEVLGVEGTAPRSMANRPETALGRVLGSQCTPPAVPPLRTARSAHAARANRKLGAGTRGGACGGGAAGGVRLGRALCR